MVDTYSFARLTHTDQNDRFTYDIKDNVDAVDTVKNPAMNDVGSNYQILVRNFTKDDVILIASLRGEPIRCPSIYNQELLFNDVNNNYIVIEISHTDVVRGAKGLNQVTKQRKTTVKIPGHMLQNRTLFLRELGYYVTIPSRLDATKTLIVQDSHAPEAQDVSVPETMVKPDPVKTLQEFEPLVKNCIERISRIQVSVGVPLTNPLAVPDYVKSLRISVYDRDFSPYDNNRMVYDPQLGPDEFQVESLHFNASLPLLSTFSILHAKEDKAFFLDLQDRQTMHGKYCALAIFADLDAFSHYAFSCQAEELYDTLQQRLANTHTNPLLRKRAEDLDQANQALHTERDRLKDDLKQAKSTITELRSLVAQRNRDIDAIRDSVDVTMSPEAVMGELRIKRAALQYEIEDLEYKKVEREAKLNIAMSNERTNTWKTAADILKSSWGIILTLVGVGGAVYKWMK